jgi:cation diffusion facilitator family transporter
MTNNLKKGQKVTEIAIALEGLLVISKFVVGFLSGGLALISDAIHSGSDFISIITSWLGFKYAQKEPTDRFQYGYYKAENIGTLLISLLIFYGAIEMLRQGYNQLFQVGDISLPFIAMALSLIDAVVLYFFGNYEVKVGKEVGAQSLISMGKENRTHILSSSAIFIGTLASYLNIKYIEGIVTLIVSLLILRIGFEALKKSVFALMDVSPEKEFFQEVGNALGEIKEIEEYYDLRLRKAGPYVFGEVKVGIRRSVDVGRSRQIAEKVEDKVKASVEKVNSLNVQVVPFESEYKHLVFPIKKDNGLDSELADCFGKANCLLFVNLKQSNIEGFFTIKNNFVGQDQKVGLNLAEAAAEKKSEILITPEIGSIAFHTLRNNLFDIYKAHEKSVVANNIDKFIEAKLEKISTPKSVS